MSLGIPEHRIYYRDSKDNWWTAGPNSPAGPSTEMFYDMTGELGDLSPEEFEAADERQDVVEIWNDVFMSYRQENGEVAAELPHKNVDTGSGLERVAAVVQGKKSIFETDLFQPVIDRIAEFVSLDTEEKKRSARIIADHIKSANFLIAEGLEPSNTGRGYILRRLIRRAVTHAYKLGIHKEPLELGRVIRSVYVDAYPELNERAASIDEIAQKEERGFLGTLQKGIQLIEDNSMLTGTISLDETQSFAEVGGLPTPQVFFDLYTVHGFPFELAVEEMNRVRIEKGNNKIPDYLQVKLKEGFDKLTKEHQEKSRSSSAGQFKGGLADANDPAVVKLHTAHHLLLAALQQVLGDEVKQRGSNITAERLRIDFTFDRKMTPEEKEEVENIVNEKIQAGLPVVMKEMPREEAEALGAQMEFGQKYPDTVSVYLIGEEGNYFSKEFCGGPHIENTSELGVFKIKKEESSSKGVRRIKAVLK
jgi:alanyl-tRNA synthetase